MDFSTLPKWTYPIILGAIIVIAGVGEYLKILPSGIFQDIFILVVGLIVPSPAFPHNQTLVTPTPVQTTESKP